MISHYVTYKLNEIRNYTHNSRGVQRYEAYLHRSSKFKKVMFRSKFCVSRFNKTRKQKNFIITRNTCSGFKDPWIIVMIHATSLPICYEL